MVKEKNKVIKNNIYVYIGCLLIAFLIMMICSANSFLYSFNDWEDLNWYITMGRGILSGKVPYRDLYDQKGPIVYYVFALFGLFQNPYIAVFIFEVFCSSLYLFSLVKLFRRNVSWHLSIIGAVVVSYITYSSLLFCSGGGAVEEYILPIYVWFFAIFKDFLDGKQLSKTQSFFVGIFMWVFVFVKFTLVLIPAILLVIWLIKSLCKKEFKQTFINLLLMLLPFIVLSAGVFVLFYLQNSLKDFVIGYFYNNLFAYSGKDKIYMGILNFVISSPTILFLSVIGLVFLIVAIIVLAIKKQKIFLYIIPLIIQILFFFAMEKVYLYYFLILSPYIALLLILIFNCLDKIEIGNWIKITITAISIIVFTGLPYFSSNTICEINRKQQDYPQYQVASDIRSYNIENVSLFCYKIHDYGFYNALGVIPTEKYFAQNNYSEESFPEMFEAFEKTISEKKCDFVVTFAEVYEQDIELFEGKYEFIKSYSYINQQNNFDLHYLTFVLLKRI